jgi:ribokinase
MIACIGDDDMGTFLKHSLKADGVDVEHVIVKSGFATGVAQIIVEDSGNNAITVAPGANAALSKDDMAGLIGATTEPDILLTQLEIPISTVRACLGMAKSEGMITILNPAPAMELDEEIFKNTDILTPNETELEFLSGHKTDSIKQIQAAGKVLLGKGVKDVVVTLGSNGCLHINNDFSKHYEAYKVKAIDTTAAGDSFNAALAVYLSCGKDMDEAIKFAMKVGAMTVTKEGAQTSLPLLDEVIDFNNWFSIKYGSKGKV